MVMSNMTVYPNPFTNNIKFQVNSAKEEMSTIRFINMNGQEVLKRSITLMPGENIVIIKDLGTMAPGMYIMEFGTKDGVMTQKIIKK